MIYLVYGEDTYRVKKKVNELRQGFATQKVICDIDLDFNWDQLEVNQGYLFGEPQVWVFGDVLDTSRGAEFFGKLQHVLERKMEATVIIIWQSGGLDERFKFSRWLKKNAEVHKFGPMNPPAVEKWIKDWLGSQEVEDAAIKKLVEYHGSNLWLIENELRKLRAYTNGEKIAIGEVELLGCKSVEENIFRFIDALSYRNVAEAGSLLDILLTEGQDPAYLFSMIVRQFRLLLLAKGDDGLKGLHPYVARKVNQQSPRWEYPILKRIYAKLLEIDVDTKMGEKELETELWLLVAELS
ncbi:DNA polymerase III subunit delta [Patescibacteria group bacterium]|nr:DNA polymerase III subunit delta [Patescibacteria group bacterium]MBU1868061.1 DNA polymerase III subunit delta [Patescibacteria group bacterium]